MLQRLLRALLADIEVGIAVPIGCLLPLAAMFAVAIAMGVFIGMGWPRATPFPDHVVVRVIDDGAKGGPQILSTQVVPLR